MKAKIASALCLLALSAVSAHAQQRVISDRVAKSMPTSYLAPQCELKAGHFRVSSGGTYLKTAIETDVPENKTRILGQGRKVLLQAIEENDQGKNGAAWYYLGRISLNEGDIVGADTSFTRAEQLAPQCAADIQNHRRSGWVALVNAGRAFEEQKNTDSALVMYRQAAAIYPASPITPYSIAAILNEKGQTDSAAVYFGRAASAPNVTDTSEVTVRNRSAFNQGAIYLNSKKYPEAAAAFERYLKWQPKDVEAQRGLAAAYRGSGQVDKAQAIEQKLVASGAGAAPGGAAGGAAGGAGAQDLMSVGVNLYNDKKYPEAAKAFEQVATVQPYDRDALFNLANTYLAMKDGPKLLATAQRLVAIEPMNETTLKLVGEGYKQSKKVDDAVKTAEKVLALPIDIKVTNFAASGAGADLAATATGRTAQTAAGKPIKPAPVALTVEFIDAKGGVIGSQDVAVPPLEPGATHDIKAAGKGAGIVAWRYKQK